MIEDVDASLRAALLPVLPSGVEVTFDPPAADGKRPSGGQVNLLLVQATSERTGMVSGYTNIRDERGRTVGRKKLPRRYRLRYLVSAAGRTAADEHRLLGRALTSLGAMDVMPGEHLPASLTDAGTPVVLAVAEDSSGRHLLDTWQAFGNRPRGFFEITVTVTVYGPDDGVVAVPAAPGEIALDVSGGDNGARRERHVRRAPQVG